ncbi:MAG: DUF669 domain-containing protein [Patescibacteria group bacterium]
MKINFNGVPDAQDFAPVPAGTYTCRVSDVEETSTNDGADMWNLTFEIVVGEYRGKRIFDRLVFSEKAMKRVKLICKRFGIDVDAAGEVEILPSMFLDKAINLDVEIEQQRDKSGAPKVDENGKPKMGNKVTFAGYHEVSGSAPPPPASTPQAETALDDDLPF